MTDFYHCPFCSNLVSFGQQMYRCGQCDKSFPIKDGIPDFLAYKDKDVGWEVNQKDKEFIDLSARIGWQEAVQQLFEGANQEFIRTDPIRGTGCLITSLNPDSRVLDVGCGWGVLTFYLANLCKEVHCFDSCYDFLRFIKIRAGQDRYDNIYPVRTEFAAFPYPENYFDLVMLNGILEHIPVSYPGNPEQIQVDFLRKVNRVLKPGGEIYLGIENRFGFKYFLGVGEDHMRLPFLSILPRSLADVYAKIAKGTPYRYRTQSYIGLKRIFSKAGFKITRAYMPHVDFRKIQLLIDLDNPASFELALEFISKQGALKPKNYILKLVFFTAVLLGLHRLRLGKIFANSFSLVAEKQ